MKAPTAQAMLPLLAVTPVRKAEGAGFGLGATFQRTPFQCSIRVRSSPPRANEPTAQALPGEVAETPLRLLSAR